MSKSILITGAEGFVGQHLCSLFINEGWLVAGTRLMSLGGPPLCEGVIPYTCDLCRLGEIKNIVKIVRPDAVIHLAAQSHVPTAWKNPAQTFRVNVFGTLNLFRAVESVAPECRILSVGSAEVYGRVRKEDLPVSETQLLAPLNPYAVSKAAQDMLAGQWAASPGLDIVRVRPFNHTGPGQGDNFVCSAFARQAAEISLGLRPPRVEVGNLDVKRDFLDVRDVCRAYLALIEKGEKGAFYNLASGKAQNIKLVLGDLLSLTRKKVEVVNDPERMRPVDQPVMKGDPSLLRKTTGWKPTITFKQTLEDLFKWWRQELKKKQSS